MDPEENEDAKIVEDPDAPQWSGGEDNDDDDAPEEIIDAGDDDGAVDAAAVAEADDAAMGDAEAERANEATKVYLPGDPLEEGETLVMDASAYVAFCEFTAEWPCLTFDVVRDGLGDTRTTFPMTLYMVAGTQAAAGGQNKVTLMRISNINRLSNPDEDDEDDDDEDGESKDPQLAHQSVKHRGTVNRLKANPTTPSMVASWSDTGHVHIWDLSVHARLLEDPANAEKPNVEPLFSFQGHGTEGYALDWSTVAANRLATGACNSTIHIWEPREDGHWAVNPKPAQAHTASVEDIQWSPSESNVLASCSVDRTIKIWDVRQGVQKAALSVEAHGTDVNVISWNKREQHLLVSGSDDGVFSVWDLRTFPSGKPEALATFKWHTKAVTGIEWHPTDASVLVVSGEDDQVSLWDMAVEADEANVLKRPGTGEPIPPQLLFVHQGQKAIKEVHWHPQLPGVVLSTASSGFNIFKSISV